jgi:hypothetical protein
MDMQGALRARVIAAATAAADRVYWVERPQSSALPAITLQVISGDRPQTMSGFQDTRTARVQMDVWADTYAQAHAVRDAAIAALAPKETSNGVQFGRMFFEGEQDFAERTDIKTIHRASVDLIVWHTPA